ncbi:MAG TPA: sugar dehydrogenase complex small subunit [Thermomicrobiales bacterium]|nr:sugar dehydrogenase complex small subunit [Thermomicrobiales bacterium]
MDRPATETATDSGLLAWRMSRRRFIGGAALAVAGGVLTACGARGSGAPTATAPPAAHGAPGATAVPGVDEFLRASRALTGFDDLQDRDLAATYLRAIAARPDLGPRLPEFYRRAGFAAGTPAAGAAPAQGALQDAGLRAVADAIAESWYTGIVQTAAGTPTVAAYTTALVWPALGYRPTGPSTCGGRTNYWADPPAGAS